MLSSWIAAREERRGGGGESSGGDWDQSLTNIISGIYNIIYIRSHYSLSIGPNIYTVYAS